MFKKSLTSTAYLTLAAMLMLMPVISAAAAPAGEASLPKESPGSESLYVKPFIIESVQALDATATQACKSTTTHLGDDVKTPPQPAIVPPEPSEDENWPIVERGTEVVRDARGEEIIITYIVRRNPETMLESPTAVATSCTFVANESKQSTQTIQGITQYLKSYYYRYKWVNGSQIYKAYWIYKTEEWWTRTSTLYTLGKNSTVWTYNGWDCSNVYSANSASGGFTPVWYNSTETYHYIYDFTRNWPIKTPGAPIGLGNINTHEETPAYKSGIPIGTLETEVRLYGS